MRLIDADELRNEWLYWNPCDCIVPNDILDSIDDQPTVDIEPAKRGKWEIGGVSGNGVIGNWCCSECDGVSLDDSDFCPHCGAKMDGEA